jgi:hypothetical protein
MTACQLLHEKRSEQLRTVMHERVADARRDRKSVGRSPVCAWVPDDFIDPVLHTDASTVGYARRRRLD